VSGRLLSRALVGAPPFAAGVRTPRGGRAGGEGGRGTSVRGSSTRVALGRRSDIGPDMGHGAAREWERAGATGRIRERARREAAAY